MGDWTQVAENLVRHSSGNYYLRAKIDGKVIRVGLKVKSLRLAKLKRDEKLNELRADSGMPMPSGVNTLGDCLTLAAERICCQANIKASTLKYYRQLEAKLRGSIPTAKAPAAWRADEVLKWWQRFSASMAPTRANNCLRILRDLFGVAIAAGLRRDNPSTPLKRRRVKATGLSHLPSREEFERIVESIRGQKKRSSEESADFVEWLAWSGMRISEACAFCWEHESGQWLTVTGGETGTKNGRQRNIPKFEALKRILDRRRYPGCTGPVFSIKTPRIALDNACERLGIPHIRIHDLKHLFMTTGIENGIDVPTMSKWGGHQDGGVLAMKTYGHIRDEHSLQAAKKMV